MTDTWGWEIPAGRVGEDETPYGAAERESVEETGWRPGPMRAVGAYFPLSGAVAQRFHVFVAEGAAYEREPDGDETDRVEWVPVARVRELIRSGQLRDGLSLTALLWALAFSELR